MNRACELCKGACCESIVASVTPSDESRWLALHGMRIAPNKVELALPCKMLCAGKCSIWKDRPEKCITYEVGGAACRETVLRRRTNWQEIFDALA